ncbi:MAG: hypothetical protein WBM17_10450 [Anaerolineales bacterium]
MERKQPIQELFLDLGGVLLANHWDREARRPFRTAAIKETAAWLIRNTKWE